MTHPALDLAAAVLGAGVGPLLDVAVKRFPQHQSAPAEDLVLVGVAAGSLQAPADTARPHSRREGCTHECRRPVPQRALVISGLAAGLFAALAARLGGRWELLPALALTAALIPLAFCDAEHLLLPRRLTWMGTALVAVAVLVASAATGDWHHMETALISAAALGAGMALISFINPAWLGFGDSRLSLMIGLGIGWISIGPVIGAMLIANIGAGLGGLVVVASGRRNQIKALPLGVFLAAGAIATLLI